MLKTYLTLTKPGIIFGNAITVVGGFAIAAKGLHFDWRLFLATLLGLSAIIASACVCNNYIDRNADQKMERTKKRALATGKISVKNAITFALLLILFGSLILSVYTNPLTLVIALIGFFVYVFLYSDWKYRSTHGTIIGSIAGGVPPVVGYCAISNRFDAGALILFMMILLWQMPHFFAIAIYRLEDYKAASIPVLPLKKGMQLTKIHMLLYIIAFMVFALMLPVFGYAGYTYLGIVILLCLIWLRLCIKGFRHVDSKRWARKMFLFSLIIVTVLCIVMVSETAFAS